MTIGNHLYLIPIEGEEIIWRYLNLNKFKSIVRDKALFFTRLDKFDDPFEGSIPKKEIEARLQYAKNYADQHDLPFNPDKDDKPIADEHRRLKNATIANCWHINKNESEAMWRLYLGDAMGVAIQSRATLLLHELGDIPETLLPSKIRYIDYEKDIWFHPNEYPIRDYNFLTPFIHKRIEIQHEREFRIFIQIREAEADEKFWESEENPNGRLIKIRIEKVVEKIVFSPNCNDEGEELIKKLVKTSGYNFSYEKSKMNSRPIF